MLNNRTTVRGEVARDWVVRELRGWLQEEKIRPGDIQTVVLEVPHVYQTGAQSLRKVDPADLITLAVLAGRLAEASGARARAWVYPSAWKGQVPKPKAGQPYIIERRVLQALSPEEQSRVAGCLGSLRHNLYDGLGLGLAWFGRLPGHPRVGPS